MTALTLLEQKVNIASVAANASHVQARSLTMAERAPLTENNHYEDACDQAIAMCGGNLRGAIKALIMANEYLEAELEKLQAEVLAAQAISRKALGAA
jgi:hypothetical protein